MDLNENGDYINVKHCGCTINTDNINEASKETSLNNSTKQDTPDNNVKENINKQLIDMARKPEKSCSHDDMLLQEQSDPQLKVSSTSAEQSVDMFENLSENDDSIPSKSSPLSSEQIKDDKEVPDTVVKTSDDNQSGDLEKEIVSEPESSKNLQLVDYNTDDSDILCPLSESKKRKSEDSGSESENDYMDAQGDCEETTSIPAKKFKRFFMGTASSDSDENSSSSESSSSSSSDDSHTKMEKKKERRIEEENWLKKDISALSNPKWCSTYQLRKRETLQSSLFWPVKVCSSRAMVSRFQLHSKLFAHRGCVNALHFNPSGTLIASGSDDLHIMLWDWAHNTSQPAIKFDSGHKSNVFQTKFFPNSNDSTVVSSARDGQVRVADISTTGTCRATKKVAQHRGSAHKLALHSDARSTFLSCGEDAIVFGIDLRADNPSSKLVTVKSNNKKIPLYSIHLNPVRPYEFAVSGRDENARIYDRRMLSDDASPLKLYCPHHLQASQDSSTNITCLVYNWDGSELLCSYNDEDIYLFDTSHSSGADYISRYKGHRNSATVKGVNFYGPYSEFIVSGSDCGNVFFWEKKSSRVVSLVSGDRGGVVNVLEPHPNLPLIATSGLDHEVKIWSPHAESSSGGMLDNLHAVMLSNFRDRRKDYSGVSDTIDDHMLRYLLNAFRGSRRNRSPFYMEDDSSAEDSDLSDSSASSENSGSMRRCLQS